MLSHTLCFKVNAFTIIIIIVFEIECVQNEFIFKKNAFNTFFLNRAMNDVILNTSDFSIVYKYSIGIVNVSCTR